MRALIVLAASLAALASPCIAQNAAAARPSASFACGGVGAADQERMKSQASHHDLMLTFAVSNGAYLADVDVEIRNGQGAVVLAAKCDGPIMLVDLPAGGTWRVTARSNGQMREKVITAGGGKPAQATLVWPAGA